MEFALNEFHFFCFFSKGGTKPPQHDGEREKTDQKRSPNIFFSFFTVSAS